MEGFADGAGEVAGAFFVEFRLLIRDFFWIAMVFVLLGFFSCLDCSSSLALSLIAIGGPKSKRLEFPEIGGLFGTFRPCQG
jgi:hypothetical protein